MMKQKDAGWIAFEHLGVLCKIHALSGVATYFAGADSHGDPIWRTVPRYKAAELEATKQKLTRFWRGIIKDKLRKRAREQVGYRWRIRQNGDVEQVLPGKPGWDLVGNLKDPAIYQHFGLLNYGPGI